MTGPNETASGLGGWLGRALGRAGRLRSAIGRQAFAGDTSNRARGRAAEVEAARWLRARGYRIVAENVVNAAGEIDLVARSEGVLCFIEVKARSDGRFGPALEAVDAAKQRRLARAAALYLAAERLDDEPCRFDVLGLDHDGERWRFSLVQDAFRAG